MGPFATFRKHHRGAEHLRICTECTAAVDRERRYLERLRSAEIPAASTDFTSRLLQHTHVLAAAPEPANARRRIAVRTLAICASCALTAAGILTAAAIVVAGDPLPQDAPAAPASVPGLLSLVPGSIPAEVGSPTGGGSSVDTLSRQLTAADLATLRAEGWACPELELMGYQLSAAKAVVRHGVPVVELHLVRGEQGATVVEQRLGTGGSEPAAPVNIRTGRPAPEDGFVAAHVPSAGAATEEGDGPGSAPAALAEAWVRTSNPVAVIYRSRTAVLSFFADPVPGPHPVTAEVLLELARAGAGAEQAGLAGVPAESGVPATAGQGQDEPVTDRIARGFRVMLGLPEQ